MEHQITASNAADLAEAWSVDVEAPELVAVDGTVRTMAVAEGRLVVTSEVAPGQHRVTPFAP